MSEIRDHEHHVNVATDQPNDNVQIQQRIQEFQPSADIEEAKEEYIVTVDLPGVNANEIQVNLDKEILTIEAHSEIEGFLPRVYRRQFRVMRGLDSAKCRADYKQGILTLRLPKPSKAIPQQIKISCE